MKKIVLITIGIISFIFSSCSKNDALKDYCNSANYINELYSDFSSEIHESFIKTGLIGTRVSDDKSILGSVLQMNYAEIESYGAYSMQMEAVQDSILNTFFKYYSANDFAILNRNIEKYIKNGGHDISLVKTISNRIPNDLVSGFVYMCATADNMASKDIWNWFNDSTYVLDFNCLQISYANSAIEYHCRQAFWDKIKLMVIATGSEYLIALACGPAMPDVDVLVTIEDIIGAGSAAAEYFACCRYGIT